VDLPGLMADAREENRAVVLVPGQRTKRETLIAFRDALGLPAHMGLNLDALADVLDDHLSESPGAVELIWDGSADLREHDQSAYEGILEVLTELSDAYPSSQVTVIDR
jgi:RNAse (barnase) inhibitor barstar